MGILESIFFTSVVLSVAAPLWLLLHIKSTEIGQVFPAMSCAAQALQVLILIAVDAPSIAVLLSAIQALVWLIFVFKIK